MTVVLNKVLTLLFRLRCALSSVFIIIVDLCFIFIIKKQSYSLYNVFINYKVTLLANQWWKYFYSSISVIQLLAYT